MSLTNIELGKYLTSIRSSLNLSTYDVNKICGISQSYLSLVENGKRKPSAMILNKLSSVYHLDCLDLYKKAGYIENLDSEKKDQLKNKLIALTETMKEENIPNIALIPLYKNLSNPNIDYNEIIGYIPINPTMYNIQNTNDYFYLKLEGNTINRLIPSGNYILIKKQKIANEGDIILFTLNDSQVRIKKYKKINSNIILLESLSTDEHIESIPIYLDDSNLKIIGKIVAHIGIMEMI